jgi:large subunit ribosomal protein L9
MQIILRKDYDTLGKIGDVVTVKPGYARNFLIPGGVAYSATKANLARLDHDKKMMELQDLKERRRAGDMHAKLHDLRLIIPVQTGEEDRMFGAVTSADIAEAIKERGIEIDRRKIQLAEPIKNLGEFSIPVKLHREVTAIVKVDVVKES